MKCYKCGGTIVDGWTTTKFMADGTMHVCKHVGDTDDFLAFRRQVLLALVSSNWSNLSDESLDQNMWQVADRIARAEPKE